MATSVFDIKIQSDMATISKLHMGKNPETGDIKWDETNAGFVHALLLLNYLCVRNKIKVPNLDFELIGNISIIRYNSRDGSKEYRLAGGNNSDVNSFNLALKGFAKSVDHIGREMKTLILSARDAADKSTTTGQEDDKNSKKSA